METTLTMAGQLALAGAARPAAASAPYSPPLSAAAMSSAPVAAHGGSGTHQASTWTTGAIAEITTFVVLDRKNRPSRQPSELSP